MIKRRALDTFCCAGGATRGYQRAGFYVVGVDNRPQPGYVGDEFIQADALDVLADRGFLATFDLVCGSPPCQDHSATRQFTRRRYPDLIAQTRHLMRASGIPYVIENVIGSPLPHQDTLDGDYGVLLCGSMFGLGTADYKLRRHRLFEASFPIPQPADRCEADPRWTIGIYGKAARARGTTGPSLGMDAGREAMGIDWMNGDDLSEAIPPAYTEYIGRQLMTALEVAA